MNGRKVISLNCGWKFCDKDIQDAYKVEFDDSSWQNIDVPHDWAISRPFNRETPCGQSQGYFDRWGVGWYRRSFQTDMKDGAYILLFDGIYENSTVWVNGIKAGGRPYGYAGFYIDITKLVHKGVNKITVCVDNTQQPADRWYSGAGIYRNVKLIMTGSTHIAPWGVYITTPSVNADNANVHIETEVDGCINGTCIEASIKTKGKVISYGNSCINDGTAVIDMEISSPMLWKVDNPVLYTAVIDVYNNGILEDSEEVKFGIRKVTIDSKNGLVVNGKSIKLKGVNLHHDGGCIGAAVSAWTWERRLKALKSMGCNAIRTSHNMPSPELLDLCDRLGFLVIDEAFDKWHSGYYGRYFNEWWKYDLEFMLKRDRNHPCVIIWSVGNEVENQGEDCMIKVLSMLADFVHKHENSRPVTFAMNPHCAENQIPLSVEAKTELTMKMAEHVDLIGCNYHEQWYEAYHNANSNLVIVGTEAYPYYSGKGNDFAAFEPINPWFYVEKNNYVIGQFLWSGIDYLGEARPYPSKGWSSAPIDTCGVRKTRSWLTESLWSDKPMVHIAIFDDTMRSDMEQPHWSAPKMCSHWNFMHRIGEVLTIATFTNCDSVELIVNGRLYSQKRLMDFADRIIKWNVPYEPGTIEAIGYKNGKKLCNHILQTAGEPIKINLKADRSQICSDGCDVFYGDVEITDKDGNIYPYAENNITFEVYGPGRIIGVDNGDLCSDEPYTSNHRHAFRGRCCAVIRSDGEAGMICVRASAEGLLPAQVTVRTIK
ncbi:MAG: glycoside hydrolase family 2 TIM barrel-domain containing protein [Clostridiales bacterium]|nr:glycoside hydrolase family 2 TIM barrel-domain containing protein [Clostridiales bacterium]